MKVSPPKSLNVGLIILFGSRATNAQHSKSDVDIGIVFHKPPRPKDAVSIYDALYSLFQKKYPGKTIDIVYLHETPYKLQFRAMAEGRVLYRSSYEFEADWKEQVMKRFFDFAFIDKIFEKAFLEAA